MAVSPESRAAVIAKGREMMAALTDELARLGTVEADILCARALAAIDTVSQQLLAAFLAELAPSNEEELARLKREYMELMVEFAGGVRESVTDASRRHAIVQRLQCKILEQERDLRSVLPRPSAAPDRA